MTIENSFNQPLRPKSVAVWLIENTALTFKQIADFCKLCELEVEALANEEIHKTLKGMSPVTSGETTEEEIKKSEENPNRTLNYIENKEYINFITSTKEYKKSLKQEKLNKLHATLWIIQNYPDAQDTEIAKLLKTTKNVVATIRAGNHKSQSTLEAKNPIFLNLATLEDLDNLK